jgi:hypothetical protein
MADFSIGSLLKKLPSAQSVVGTAKNIAGKAAEGAGNMAFPGAGTTASLALQYPKSVPVRGLVQGGATAAGIGAQLGGFATTSIGVGLGLGAAGMGLSAAAPSLGNEAQYRWNQLTGGKQNPTYFGPAYGNVNVPSGGPRNFGPDYKNRELAAGQAAENFRTGAGFPGQSPAAERAYQSELSRTSQLAAQDPEMQRWAAQREADVKSKDYSKSEDMGMRIWAEKHEKLARKVKPGQAGYDVIQQVLQGKTAPSAPANEPGTPGFNAYSSNYKLPGLEEYANSMQNAIVRTPGVMPSFAIDNPMQGDYRSTINQAYNLPYPLVSRTTEGTLSLPWGEINRLGGSEEAGGIYPGAPLKLPVPPTQFGAPGYPTLTADNLLPAVDVSRAFTANGMDPKFKAFANAMYKNN